MTGEGTARREALTGVPPQGAAGDLLPQVRKEEVPGGLEILEVAELDNGAGHGSGEPHYGTHLTSPRPAPSTPLRPPPSPNSSSQAEGGETKPEAVTDGSAVSEYCAGAGWPRRLGRAGPGHVTRAPLLQVEPKSTWSLGADFQSQFCVYTKE